VRKPDHHRVRRPHGQAMHRVGFVINPIAGMGGRVGLKGTDDVVEEAVRRGARPTAQGRAEAALRAIAEAGRRASPAKAIRWLTCSGAMGSDALAAAGFQAVEVTYEAPPQTGAADTVAAVERFVRAGAELILFCGGDGTARDICAIVGQKVPILGIPAGVKMHSGVFAMTPQHAAAVLWGFLDGRLAPTPADVLDVDEARYRHGEWVVRLYATALTPFEPSLTQAAKAVITERSDAEVKAEIAEFLCEEIAADPDALVLLGPGSTVQSVARRLGFEKTPLGIDAVAVGTRVGSDLDEAGILALLDDYPRARLILSPIGAQGFVLGRGNLQISPVVVRRIGRGNIVVVATPAKLARTPVLRFDTGDAALDAELVGRGFIPVVIGYDRRRLVKAAA
jgi:predicted polyphosphate/ATP-dependent NAD kinase